MRAVIAEDQALLREGLVFVVESAGFEIAGTADSGISLLEITRTEKPDLVVTDIRMPPTFTDEGLVAALEIRRTQPSTAVLVLSQFVQRRYALELVRQRGAGSWAGCSRPCPRRGMRTGSSSRRPRC